ncbi:MAG: histidine triad nucleotide-binding protein [Veillonellaceae bacterium]|nr:histidine triad nucleotide-binding protein [Veillonellaceae bacterium]
MNCIFCQIAAGEIPAQKVYEDDRFFAFHDVAPTAPVHVLLIPKTHIASIAAMTDAEEAAEMPGFFAAIRTITRQLGIEEGGYRLVVNTGADGGQTVPHFHAHIIGGKALGWPPFHD